jgi:hypothetical protein
VKASEIQIGQEYAHGTKDRRKTYRRCRVLEIAKHRVLEGSDKEVPAARVEYLDVSRGDLNPDNEITQWVVLRSILMPWAEHMAEQAKHDQAKQAYALGPENAERARIAIKELAEIGFDTGTASFELVGERAIVDGFVRVQVSFLEDVLDALT